MANSDPAVPLSPDTGLCGWILLEPKLAQEGFKQLTKQHGSKILFLAAMPIYKEEMALKISEGVARLAELFDEFAITELVDTKRVNVAGKNELPKQ